MLHQIRQPIRPGNIGGAKAEQVKFHRAMRAHGAPGGGSPARGQVNFAIRPRHQPAQPEPKCEARRIGFRPTARSGQRCNRCPAIACCARAGAGGFLCFPGGAQEMRFGRGNAPMRAAPGFRK